MQHRLCLQYLKDGAMYLHHFDGVEERQGKGGQHDQDGAEGEQERADTRCLLAVGGVLRLTGAIQTNPVYLLHPEY